MKYLGLLPILAVAACTTPRQQCTQEATRDLVVISGLIAESEQILERGYALEKRGRTRGGLQICSRTRSGNIGVGYCFDTVTDDTPRPVAVDLAAERAKLESLRAKRNELQIRSQAALASCQAQFPET